MIIVYPCTGCENSPLVSLKTTVKVEASVGNMNARNVGGSIATTTAECNEHLRMLHKQLTKVLKSKPPSCPNDVG